MSDAPIFGTLAGFRTVEAVVAAARHLQEAGVRRWEVYGPAPIEEIETLRPSRRGACLTLVMVAAALAGACFGYFIQYWDAVLGYPINVGGRPYNGWPGFVPSAWELCALFAVYAGFFGFLASCRLPRLYHPIFAAPDFERASQDRFFISVEAADQQYDPERLRHIFQHHGAFRIAEVSQ